MAWTSPFTAVLGATITAASHNTGYRDNLNAIWVYTTAGDLAYASAADTLARLAIGADDTVLRSTGTAPSWGNLPFQGAKVNRSTTQTITNNTLTAMSFDTEEFDVGGYWVVGSPTRLDVPQVGYYLVGCWVKWTANTTGYREVGIYKNGSGSGLTVAHDNREAGDSISNATTIAGQDYASADTDYYELYVLHTRGSDLTTLAGVTFWIRFLGD